MTEDMPLTIERRRVLRTFSCSSDPLDIFDGFVRWKGSKARTNRRWFGQGPGKYGNWLNSRVVFQGAELDYGDDPRPFVSNGYICILSNTFTPNFGFRNHLIEIAPDGSWRRFFLMVREEINAGKNWSPFNFLDGRLAFIHSFSPLRILYEIRREAGIILLDHIDLPGLPAEEGDGQGFPAHRGGTNGISIDNMIIGVGHTTKVAKSSSGDFIKSPGCAYPSDNQLVHRPFLWALDLDRLSIKHWEIHFPWSPKHWIIDPTSLIVGDASNCIEFFTTEVERSFVDPTSTGLTVSYEGNIRRLA